jgi:hypothetical protein
MKELRQIYRVRINSSTLFTATTCIIIAKLFHGHCLVLHVIFANISDDSNRMLHCPGTSLGILRSVRQQKGLSAHLPPNLRWQVGGVSTNWGMAAFAHIQHLVNMRVLGESAGVVRNPIGSDADVLFAIAKMRLKNADCVAFGALPALTRGALQDVTPPSRSSTSTSRVSA